MHIISLGVIDSNEEVERKNTICWYSNNFSQREFETVAINVAKRIKRLYVFVDRYYVIGQVRTSSGINTWEFKLDFNDYGRITGNYWFTYRDNYDSQIPDTYAKELKNEIQRYIRNMR